MHGNRKLPFAATCFQNKDFLGFASGHHYADFSLVHATPLLFSQERLKNFNINVESVFENGPGRKTDHPGNFSADLV